MIELRTLGALDLTAPGGGRILSVLQQEKRLALLVFLTLESPGTRKSRRTLIELLWPELDRERARAALRNGLYFLRRSLGDRVITGEGEAGVDVDAGRLRCDAIAFERALDAGDLEEGLKLYGGDFLRGLDVSGAPEFERWADARRAGLRRRARLAARELAARAVLNGDPAAAARWAYRGLEIDPYDEISLRHLLGALDASGDRAEALRDYERFAVRLAADLSVEPSPATREAVDRLRAGPRAAGGP